MQKYMGQDMIANLITLPECPPFDETVRLKRAFAGDKEQILDFIGENFQKSWIYEAEKAILLNPGTCFIATRQGKIVGFSCYDTTAKGFFGPIGVLDSERGKNVGAALLFRTMEAMREAGYAYAVIGWVNEAENFYRKTVKAEFIPGGEPQNSIYSNLVFME